MRKRRPRTEELRRVEVAVTLCGIPCIVSGVELEDPEAAPERRGIRRLWHTIRGRRSGMFFAPEWLGLRGWLDVELRAEAEYRPLVPLPG